mmetsp:Transcript_75308/g.147429  ORF Transcript_75308/g.147429 Transcript_75308/m.147429 type:complete len:298 (-) Transcript_75308:141-1034(-)
MCPTRALAWSTTCATALPPLLPALSPCFPLDDRGDKAVLDFGSTAASVLLLLPPPLLLLLLLNLLLNPSIPLPPPPLSAGKLTRKWREPFLVANCFKDAVSTVVVVGTRSAVAADDQEEEMWGSEGETCRTIFSDCGGAKLETNDSLPPAPTPPTPVWKAREAHKATEAKEPRHEDSNRLRSTVVIFPLPSATREEERKFIREARRKATTHARTQNLALQSRLLITTVGDKSDDRFLLQMLTSFIASFSAPVLSFCDFGEFANPSPIASPPALSPALGPTNKRFILEYNAGFGTFEN